MSEDQIPQMKPESMYLEETFTDQEVGQIRRMTPVTAEGDPDSSREVLFVGFTQMMSPQGPIPLNFEIEAATLGEAISKFSEGARDSMVATIKQIEEMQRQQASSIVVPGQGQTESGIQLP